MCSASTERPSAASADLPTPPIASEAISASATAKYLRHAASAPPGTFTVPLPLLSRGVGGAAVCGNPAASIIHEARGFASPPRGGFAFVRRSLSGANVGADEAAKDSHCYYAVCRHSCICHPAIPLHLAADFAFEIPRQPETVGPGTYTDEAPSAGGRRRLLAYPCSWRRLVLSLSFLVELGRL